MELLYPLASILIITWFAWEANNWFKFRICPVCVGVSATWLLVAIGMLTGYLDVGIYRPILAILIGGTAIGVGNQGEKTFNLVRKNSLWFKLAMMFLWFTMAYLNFYFLNWILFAIETAVLAVIGYVYFIFPHRELAGSDENRKKYIEEQLKNCC